jgi:zinc/manganese transport system substrate-binding protein
MKRVGLGAGIAAVAVLALAGCGSSDDTDGATADPTGTTVGSASCPVEPLQVVVSVSQWGDVVEQLGGECAEVTTIIEGGDVDPHDFEPSPADSAAFGDADLVVVNGLDYDHWAEDAISSASSDPAVVDGGEVVGLEEGDNPHLWYGPDYVQQVAEAVTSEMKVLSPEAAAYFDEQAAAWTESLQPYLAEISSLTATASGAPYAATESVFEYMAQAIGMVDETPEGYRSAAANESDPAPGDINAFEELLRGGSVDVVIYNSQTEGSIPEQLRSVAEGADVPVVEVTESVPPSATSFVDWQLAQLRELSSALGG